jgi:cytochrome c556
MDDGIVRRRTTAARGPSNFHHRPDMISSVFLQCRNALDTSRKLLTEVLLKPLLSAFLLAGVAPALLGAASPGAVAAQQRHAHFETIGRAFKGVQDQLKRRPVNLAAVRNTSAVLATLASRTKTWFPAGSGPQHGVKTDALPAAWTNRPELDRQADRFAAAASSLAAAAELGDIPRLQAAVRTTGEACKGCHDQFRKR